VGKAARVDPRYQLLDRIGAGGMSVVWRAHDDVLGRDVAVKVLSSELASDPALLSRIRLEARSAAGLRHPNIVEVYDYGESSDGDGPKLPYIVMELVAGQTLDQVLQRGALPWRTAVLIGAQAAAALTCAHERGVVHRDVKPGNLMVTPLGIKLVDFGISAAVGEADEADGQVLGTPAYLAPERLDGGPVRPATDVYALGLLLYRMLAGRLPWETSTLTQMVRAHLYAEPAALPRLPGLPPEVADLVRRCLAKRPQARPTAAQVAAGLGAIAGLASIDLPAAGVTAGEATVRVRRRLPSRRRNVLVASAVAAGVAVASLVWWPSAEPGKLAAGPAPAVAAEGHAAPVCTVSYTVRDAAQGRMAGAVAVENGGPTPLATWRLTFALPDGQHIVREDKSRWRQDGRQVRVEGAQLAAGGTATTSFAATYEGAVMFPTSFQVNGQVCRPMLAAAPPSDPTVRTASAPRPAAGAPKAPAPKAAAPKPAAPKAEGPKAAAPKAAAPKKAEKPQKIKPPKP
jgi:hypothetical protein